MAKGNGSRTPRSEQRRQELRRKLPRPAAALRQAMTDPAFIRCLSITLLFLLAAAMLVIWSREKVLLPAGRVAVEAQLARMDYEVENAAATQAAREEAAAGTPTIYVPNAPALESIGSALKGLPTAIGTAEHIDDVAETLRKQFGLTAASLEALRPYATAGPPTDNWAKWTDALTSKVLLDAPLLAPEAFQIYTTEAPMARALEHPDGSMVRPLTGEALDTAALATPAGSARVRELARRAGFPGPLVPVVAARIVEEGRPSLQLDDERTAARSNAAAAAVEPVTMAHSRGEALLLRGDTITGQRLDEIQRENDAFLSRGPWAGIWLPRIGIVLLLVAVAFFLAAFTVGAYERIARNAWRLAAVCFLLLAMLAITVTVAIDAPALMMIAALAPLLFSTAVLRLAYDQRLALAVAGVQGAITVLALQQSIGMFMLLMASAASLIGQLREVRSRSDVIRASTGTAAIAAGCALLLGMIETPPVAASIVQVLVDALQGGAAALGIGFLLLGILPSIERLFHITTGMTLAELRDPRRPLLRQLQQRAPGTWEHSMQVASIAEAAAEAIGADGLLTYVGGLYHDIGKMHKPQYFVENQSGGENPHDTLSPTMSLLVIVNHVKDGMELADEYALPRQITHFIEAHHGTTLVEYFYHQALQHSEDDRDAPDEDTFRYPGPKPRTREAAILMIADAVESAVRAMDNPGGAQIEGLVHDIARKRLLDGQLSNCPLTLDELRIVQETIIKRVAASRHARIAYPDGDGGQDESADGATSGERDIPVEGLDEDTEDLATEA
ncbi:MAG: HDIG domain-containing protein [Phycisphaerales bacterium]|nr:HDIG domain-containing protein [Phycisphaerales bacterium]